MQFKFHLAGGFPQGGEAPTAIEAGKRAVGEADQHLGGVTLDILGAETGLDTVVVDMQRGGSDLVGAGNYLNIAAPRQELRIVLTSVHQIEHLRGCEFDQDFLLDIGHWRGGQADKMRDSNAKPRFRFVYSLRQEGGYISGASQIVLLLRNI